MLLFSFSEYFGFTRFVKYFFFTDNFSFSFIYRKDGLLKVLWRIRYAAI